MSDSKKSKTSVQWTHRYLRPWYAAAAMVPATFTGHYFWSGQVGTGIGLTLGSMTLTGLTFWAGRNASTDRQLHATGTVAAASGWFVYASMLSDPAELWTPFIIGSVVAAGSWNARQVLRVNPDKENQSENSGNGNEILTKAIGKAKVFMRKEPEVGPNKVRVPFRVDGGTVSMEEIGQNTRKIAGELGVSPTSIRVQADPDRADQGEFTIVPKDMIRQPVDWPGPSSPGGSIIEPVVIGQYEDGELEQFWFPAEPDPDNEPRNATHFLAAGMNGSGKSAGIALAICEALTRRDVIVWGVDPSKGMQTFAPFLPYLDWAEMTFAGGEAMIDVLSPVITARADALGRAGFKNWTPEAYAQLGMPYMIVWIEEAAKFFREGTEMEGLVMEARSAGISVIISLQRPSSTSMPTDVREQLGGAVVFGVKGSSTADMALPDDVRDAGARPEVWENRFPGKNYLVAPGVPEDRYPIPARTFRSKDEWMAAVLEQAFGGATACAVTAGAAGAAYANRTRYPAGQALPAAPTPIAGHTPATSADTQEIQLSRTERANIARDINREAQAIDAEVRAEDDPADAGCPEPYINEDIDAPLDVPAGWQPGPPSQQAPQKTTEQAMAAMWELIEQFRADGTKFIGPKDFVKHEDRIGRSRAWMSTKLSEELSAPGGPLRETDKTGVYEIVERQPAAV